MYYIYFIVHLIMNNKKDQPSLTPVYFCIFCFFIGLRIVPIVNSVKQWTPGSNRLTKKNLKRPNRALPLPCSPLTVVQQQIPYKKGRKDTADSVLAPENYNLVLQAVINPQIAQPGTVWSESKQQVVGAVDVHVSAPPAETVTVQPDGCIQHGRKLKKKVYIYAI
jgi:hypothetical protein